MKQNITRYLKSFSTQLGALVGGLMYMSYAATHQAFNNPTLIAVSIVVGGFIPIYSKWSNKIDEWLAFKTATVTIGRVGRFLAQWIFNIGIFASFILGGVFGAESIKALGGMLGLAWLTTAASQGIQYIAISLANREIGNKNVNVLMGLSCNIFVTALATWGGSWVQHFYLILGWGSAIGFFGIGLLSDWRAMFPKKGGVGIFFGTFNPFHRTHVELLAKALQERQLEKIYVHPTVIPKLHRDALNKGEICIGSYRDGMRVYQLTDKADVHANYFPTGNHFYEYETRCRLIQLALEDSGISKQVEVLSLPQVYEDRGFYGILDSIKKRHPDSVLHGIHGSDLGGMWVRSIYDESGWIYPYPVVRRDQVSATAIRKGASGMTTAKIEKILSYLRAGQSKFEVEGQVFTFQQGVLQNEIR